LGWKLLDLKGQSGLLVEGQIKFKSVG